MRLGHAAREQHMIGCIPDVDSQLGAMQCTWQQFSAASNAMYLAVVLSCEQCDVPGSGPQLRAMQCTWQWSSAASNAMYLEVVLSELL